MEVLSLNSSNLLQGLLKLLYLSLCRLIHGINKKIEKQTLFSFLLPPPSKNFFPFRSTFSVEPICNLYLPPHFGGCFFSAHVLEWRHYFSVHWPCFCPLRRTEVSTDAESRLFPVWSCFWALQVQENQSDGGARARVHWGKGLQKLSE